MELPSGLPLQSNEERIDINAARTFEAKKEPLGEDRHAGVRRLPGAKKAASAAAQRLQSKADPGVAQMRRDAAFVERAVAILPKGAARERLLQSVAEVRAKAERLAMAAGLQLAEVGAGQQALRRAGRDPEDREVKPLPPRSRKRAKGAPPVAPGDHCDELPTLAKRGEAVDKVRPGPALGR
jgi:hypothetical protein